MDLRLLRYFLAVADERHVTRAAARLGIQQAPLSQQIKLLERELGAVLFRRKPRGVELTEAGVALQAEAIAILASVERAVATTQRVARGEQGAIRIGLTTSACFHPFPPRVIRDFRLSHPQVMVQFEQNSTPALIRQLQAGSIDAGFIRTALGQPDGVEIFPLLEEAMVVALPAGHRLAAGGGTDRLTLEAIAEESFIGYPRTAGAGLYDSVIAACMAAGFSPDIRYDAPQIVSTLYLVAAGMGISVVPASMQRLRLDAVVYRPLAGPHQPRGMLNLAILAEASAAPALRAFVGMVREGAASAAAGVA